MFNTHLIGRTLLFFILVLLAFGVGFGLVLGGHMWFIVFLAVCYAAWRLLHDRK